MLLRVVLLVILILLAVRFVVLLVARVRAVLRAGGTPGRPQSPTVTLVPCRRCGVMVPLPRAIPDGSNAYVCRSCAGR